MGGAILPGAPFFTIGELLGVQMGSQEKILQRILGGRSDANITFSDLRSLLLHFGFDERTKGSHHIFRRPDVEERINLQKQGSQAKPYQVRQVRTVILRYGLGVDTDV